MNHIGLKGEGDFFPAYFHVLRIRKENHLTLAQ